MNFFVENELKKTLEIDFQDEQFQQIVLEHSFDLPGLYPVEFKLISEDDKENNTANNFFPTAVNVLKQKSGILVISDRLGWDIKFLKDAVRENDHWQFSFLQKDNFLKLQNKQVTLTAQMENNDVLILVNYGDLIFSANEEEMIRNFIARGGGLLIQGYPIKTLSDIMPVKDAGIKREFSATLNFTDESRKYESFNFADSDLSREIPPVRYFYCQPKLQTEILAEFNNEDRSAAIAYSQLEKGRILYFSFFDLWKWQLRDQDLTFRTFILDICNWLAMGNAERFISFSDKNGYFKGENVKINLQAYDEKLIPLQNLNAKLTLTGNTGNTILEKYLDSGEDGYFTFLKDLPADKYSYTILDEEHQQQTSGEFIVTEVNTEKRDNGFNIPLLTYISQATGGKIYNKEALADLQFQQSEITSIHRKIEIPIYKKWYLITIFIVSFCLEIYLRKRWGLL